MGTKHKHYDVIVAWAAGEEIQYFWGFQWRDWEETSCPGFAGTAEWRIKPKRVKKEGWVNVYKGGHRPDYFETYEEAIAYSPFNKQGVRVATIRIEWEEEE
jgi:hypothetical protein